jgi:hypothetical protein
MSATTLQIAIMVAVLGFLAWLAMRPSRRRGARRSSGDSSWSGDAVYNIADSGQHHGSGGHDAGSGHSASAGDSGGGSDGGGGGDGSGGGGSD